MVYRAAAATSVLSEESGVWQGPTRRQRAASAAVVEVQPAAAAAGESSETCSTCSTSCSCSRGTIQWNKLKALFQLRDLYKKTRFVLRSPTWKRIHKRAAPECTK